MIKLKYFESDCFAHQKLVFNFFGLLPSKNVFYSLYSVILLIVVTIYPFTVIPEILKLYNVNFNEFIFCLLFEIANFLCVSSMHCTFWNRFELQKLFENVQLLDELSNFNNTDGENVFIMQYKDMVRKLSYFGTALISTVLTVYTLLSVILSLNKENWILPFGSGAAGTNSNIQYILQTIMITPVTVILYLQLFTYINVLILICGHCKLLQKYILTSFTNQTGELSKDCHTKLIEKKIIDWESFKMQIRHIIRYHIGIIDVADQLETAFSLVILTFFGGISICMCLVIYHSQLIASIEDGVKDAIVLLAGYLLMIVMSSFGEKIATESGKIGSICYELDFFDCDLRIQKSLILIILRSQRSISPTIGKLKVLSLSTMLSVFQSIYTYYTFLRNMKSI